MRARTTHGWTTSRFARLVVVFSVIGAMLGALPAMAAPSTQTPTVAASADASRSVTTTSATGAQALEAPVSEKTAEFREELARRQATLKQFEAQLDELDRQLEVAQEAFNAASEDLRATQQELGVTESDLQKAQTAYDMQLDLLNGRASDIYRQGQFAVIDLLMDASSVSDLIARIKFLNTLGVRDADLAANLEAQKEQLEQTAVNLREQQARAEALAFELKARQVEILLRIQERQAMMNGAQREVLELLQTEAARRQLEQAELLADIIAGADKYGVEVVAGSPVETALAYHGIPYLWGGETPAGFDCSGLVLYVFRQHGVTLPHYSGSQFLMGQKVQSGVLQPGDVVFFGSPVHHVGIYIGSGYYIHAPKTGDFVKISKLADRSDFAGARRYPWQPRLGPIQGVSAASSSTSTTTVGALLGR